MSHFFPRIINTTEEAYACKFSYHDDVIYGFTADAFNLSYYFVCMVILVEACVITKCTKILNALVVYFLRDFEKEFTFCLLCCIISLI